MGIGTTSANLRGCDFGDCAKIRVLQNGQKTQCKLNGLRYSFHPPRGREPHARRTARAPRAPASAIAEAMPALASAEFANARGRTRGRRGRCGRAGLAGLALRAAPGRRHRRRQPRTRARTRGHARARPCRHPRRRARRRAGRQASSARAAVNDPADAAGDFVPRGHGRPRSRAIRSRLAGRDAASEPPAEAGGQEIGAHLALRAEKAAAAGAVVEAEQALPTAGGWADGGLDIPVEQELLGLTTDLGLRLPGPGGLGESSADPA